MTRMKRTSRSNNPRAKEGNRYAYAGGSLCFPRVPIWLGTCGGGT